MTKTSTSGTNSPARRLAIKDICRIIKQCQASGVKEFNWDGLSFTMTSEVVKPADTNVNSFVIDKNEKSVEPLVYSEDKLTQIDDDLSAMMASDPSGFERAIIDGHMDQGMGLNDENNRRSQ